MLMVVLAKASCATIWSASSATNTLTCRLSMFLNFSLLSNLPGVPTTTCSVTRSAFSLATSRLSPLASGTAVYTRMEVCLASEAMTDATCRASSRVGTTTTA